MSTVPAVTRKKIEEIDLNAFQCFSIVQTSLFSPEDVAVARFEDMGDTQSCVSQEDWGRKRIRLRKTSQFFNILQRCSMSLRLLLSTTAPMDFFVGGKEDHHIRIRGVIHEEMQVLQVLQQILPVSSASWAALVCITSGPSPPLSSLSSLASLPWQSRPACTS